MSQQNLFGPAPGESTSSQAASRVPTSVLPAAVPDSLASAAAFGSRCSESSPLSARVGASLRTFLLCAVAELTPFSLAWKRQATPLGRSWWVLGRSARHTGGSGSGLLLDLWPTPIAGTSGGNRGGGSNREGTYRPGLSSLLTTNWATPQAADAENANAPRRKTDRPERSDSRGGYRFDLKDQVAAEGPEVRALENWGTPRVTTNGGSGALRENSKSRLEDQVHEGGPCLAEAVGMWPTPTAESYGSSNNGCPGDGRETYATKGKPSLEGMARQDWPTPTTAMLAGYTKDEEKRAAPSSKGISRGHQGNELLRRVEIDWPTPHGMCSASERTNGPTGNELGRAVTNLEWPTPKTADGREKGNGGNRNSPGLDQMARSGDLSDWPTPATRDHHAQGATHNIAAHSSSLATIVEKKLGIVGPPDPESLNTRGNRRGSLNPDWVETLMGAPPGWTDLPEETASALLATRIRQRSRKSSGGGS